MKCLHLRTKILLYGGVPIVTVLLAVLWFTFHTMYKEFEKISLNYIKTKMRRAAQEVEFANRESLMVVQLTAYAQEHGMFGKRQETINFLQAILAAHPNLTATSLGYEPNADGQDEIDIVEKISDPRALSPLEKGRFLPYWYRSLEDDRTFHLEALVDPETSYYYQGVKNRFLGRPESENVQGKDISGQNKNSTYWTKEMEAKLGDKRAMITEPYLYEKKLIIEQTYPIIIKGKFQGIAGADRALKDLQDFLVEIKPFTTADLVLISQRGRVVAATQDGEIKEDLSEKEMKRKTLKGDRIEDTPLAELLIPSYLASEDTNPRLITDPITGRKVYLSTANIETGRWTLVMRVEEAEIFAPIWATLRFSLLFALLGVAFVIAILLWLSQKIASRVSHAAYVARQVAEGNLTVQVNSCENGDETEELLQGIGNMVHHLNSLVSQVKESSIELISTATQIRATSKQQETVVNEFGSSTHEVTAAVKEISATSQELLKTMNDVTDVSTKTAVEAEKGRQSLSGMEQSMRGLAEATSSISSRLAVIHEKSNKIGSVITTITKVSDQTNLLSLNAAIEAEKAGEYGLGFSVVAREIRRLADQTALATFDIEQMVKEMQTSVAAGVMEVDKFTDEVQHGVDKTVRIGEQFGKIIGQVQTLLPRFESVHEGMQSQSQGAAQITEAMVQLMDSARQSASSLHEFHAASQQLHHAVQGLKEEISKFKVD